MAPSRISPPPPALPSKKNATVYLVDNLHPKAVAYAKSIFARVVVPGDAEHSNWRANARYIVIKSSSLSAADIAACPRLRAIGKQGVGIDRIDAAACAARGITIHNTPGVNAGAVAELVLALAMAVARDIGPLAVRQAGRGERVSKDRCKGLLLRGCTVGVVGMGNIGAEAARLFHGAFGAEIIAYDPLLPAGAWPDLPHTRVSSLDEMFPRVDVLTLHVPLTPQTRGLVGYEQLKRMKPTAIVVNAARGGIVDEDDLCRALEEGFIWGAGLDCHVEEPPSRERYGRLWEQRVVSTPHIGAATEQTQMETAMEAIRRVWEVAVKED